MSAAHRALPCCTGACDQGRRDCSCATGHVIDRLPEDYDKPEPLSRRESIQFWLVVDAFALLGYALIVWGLKP